jgi:DNA end-binding protein Ku
MMAYTLRYRSELRNHQDYFRDIKPQQINADSLELAETLIKKRASKFDLGKFEDGYEVALKELVEAKINRMPVPKDEAPKAAPGKVVSLMDALRKSVATDEKAKKPVAIEKDPRKGIGLVGTPAKAAKRKSA